MKFLAFGDVPGDFYRLRTGAKAQEALRRQNNSLDIAVTGLFSRMPRVMLLSQAFEDAQRRGEGLCALLCVRTDTALGLFTTSTDALADRLKHEFAKLERARPRKAPRPTVVLVPCTGSLRFGAPPTAALEVVAARYGARVAPDIAAACAVVRASSGTHLDLRPLQPDDPPAWLDTLASWWHTARKFAAVELDVELDSLAPSS